MKQKVEKQFDLPTELKKIEEHFDEKFAGQLCCNDWCDKNHDSEKAEQIKSFYHTALLTLVKRVGEEVGKEMENVSQRGVETSKDAIFNQGYAYGQTEAYSKVHSLLDDMLQTGSK